MKKTIGRCIGLVCISLACQTLIPVAPTAASQSTTAQPTSMDSFAPESANTEVVNQPVASTALPVPQPITCSDDSCLDACLTRISDTIPQTSYQALTGAYAENEINLNLVYYDVKDGQLGEPEFLYVPDAFKQFQNDTTTQRNMWTYASSLLPTEQLKWIERFEIFSSSYYGGWVRPGGPGHEDRSRWVLSIESTAVQDPIGLTYILTHEYGHLLTLNADQIPASDYYYTWHQNAAICDQFLLPTGCSKSDSFVNLFYQKFWTNIFEEWLADVDTPHVTSPEEFRALVHEFYKKHPELFVREYAATNIEEDLAESFVHFVLEPKPAGTDIVAQKIRFYYDFPEMVSLRQHMIENICSYTGQ